MSESGVGAPRPKRKPPRLDPLSPHGVRVGVVGRLVSPESLRQRGAWARELQILKRLQQRYNDDTFWLTLAPAEPLESLAWFLAPFGSAALREQWNMHRFTQAQEEQIAVDMASIPPMIEDQQDEPETLPTLKPKETATNWADSE